MRAFFTYWWFFKILMTFTHGQLFGPQGVQQFNLGLYQVFKQLLKIYFRTAMIGYDTYFTIKSFRSGSMINIRIFWKKMIFVIQDFLYYIVLIFRVWLHKADFIMKAIVAHDQVSDVVHGPLFYSTWLNDVSWPVSNLSFGNEIK